LIGEALPTAFCPVVVPTVTYCAEAETTVKIIMTSVVKKVFSDFIK
jgi:hypothetical protein